MPNKTNPGLVDDCTSPNLHNLGGQIMIWSNEIVV